MNTIQRKIELMDSGNECIRCLSERNKRRHDINFSFPDWVETRADVELYLDACRYKKQKDMKPEEEREVRNQIEKNNNNDKENTH